MFKMKKRLILFLSLCFFSSSWSNLYATDLPPEKVEEWRSMILIEAVKFLACDDNTKFNKKGKEKAYKIDNRIVYSDNDIIEKSKALNIENFEGTVLKKFPKNENLTGGEFRDLGMEVVDFVGREEKKYRKEGDFLKSFKVFESNIQNIVEKGIDFEGTQAENTEPIKDNPPKKPKAPKENKVIASSSSNWYSLLLASLALIVVALTFFLQNKKNKNLESEIENLKRKITKDNLEIKSKYEKTQSNNEIDALKRELTGLKNKVEKKTTSKVEEPVLNRKESFIAKNQNPFPKIRYAKEANHDRSGFRTTDFSDKTSRSIFQIKLTSEKEGTFQIMNDPKVHAYVLQNMNIYLNGICEYKDMPEVNQRINILSPGKLRFDGKQWKIVEKMKVDFV